MKTVLKMLAICMMAGGLGVQSVYAEPLVIQEQGSFSAGGTIITAPGTFDAKKPLDSAGQTYGFVFPEKELPAPMPSAFDTLKGEPVPMEQFMALTKIPIKLNDCDTNVSSNAAVAFLGTTVTSNDDTLALQSSAAGSAQNVGIQILDRTGEVLVLDGATFSAKTDLIDGTNILPFQARYIALGQSVAGTANADATFKVQYL